MLRIMAKFKLIYFQVINGEPLPDNPFPEYQPHDSFDERGFLKAEAHDAGDQTGVASAVPPMSPEDREKRRVKMERQRSVDSAMVEV